MIAGSTAAAARIATGGAGTSLARAREVRPRAAVIVAQSPTTRAPSPVTTLPAAGAPVVALPDLVSGKSGISKQHADVQPVVMPTGPSTTPAPADVPPPPYPDDPSAPPVAAPHEPMTLHAPALGAAVVVGGVAAVLVAIVILRRKKVL